MSARQNYKIVGYRSKSGKLGTYKLVGEADDKFHPGQRRAHLRSFDGKIDFWIDAAKVEEAPPAKKKSTCSCEDDCCVPYCRCAEWCNCNGGNIYDC